MRRLFVAGVISTSLLLLMAVTGTLAMEPVPGLNPTPVATPSSETDPEPETQSDPDPTDIQVQAIIELLKQKGVITDTEALNFMERMKDMAAGSEKVEMPAADEPEAATKEELDALKEKIQRTNDAMTIDQRLLQRRVDDMESNTLDSLKQQVIKSSWAQRISLSGDIRLRYQSDTFADDNDPLIGRPDDPETRMNTTEDRQRFRYRARLGLKANLLDFRERNVGKVEVGFRVTTGNEDDPVSTNDTMGDYFNRDSVFFRPSLLEVQVEADQPVYRPYAPDQSRRRTICQSLVFH